MTRLGLECPCQTGPYALDILWWYDRMCDLPGSERRKLPEWGRPKTLQLDAPLTVGDFHSTAPG